MTEQSNKLGSINVQPTANGDASAARDAKSTQTLPACRPVPPEAQKAARKRKLPPGALGVAVRAVLPAFGIPCVEEMLNTASTDDAFVDGHVTFVATHVPVPCAPHLLPPR
jgi:membrane fusion protein (multidrug efflux system)